MVIKNYKIHKTTLVIIYYYYIYKPLIQSGLIPTHILYFIVPITLLCRSKCISTFTTIGKLQQVV